MSIWPTTKNRRLEGKLRGKSIGSVLGAAGRYKSLTEIVLLALYAGQERVTMRAKSRQNARRRDYAEFVRVLQLMA